MTAATGEPVVLRIADRHVFGLELPWLPAVGGRDAESMSATRDAFGRQIAMLRALSETGHGHSGSLQLRIVVDEQTQGGRASTVLRILLLGAASRADHALTLRERLIATLPPEFVVEPASEEVLAWVMDRDDAVAWRSESLVEIRRAIESSDPENDADERDPLAPVLLRWTWTWVNLVASLGALHRLPRGAQLIVHLEPRSITRDALGFLREEIAHLRNTYADDLGDNPLLVAVVNGYRQWLRDLPRACLHVRVLLACPGFAIPVGLPEIVGADLTRSWETGAPVGTFDVVRPVTPPEVDCALAMVQLMRSEPIHAPAQPELAELLHLFDPHEASAAFRIPVPGPEGLPGLRTEPASMLPRGLASPVVGDRPSVVLGSGPSGDTVSLGYSELNRHMLVAGLPGYGKTTTVQSLLLQLWRAPLEQRIPFLVLDPAKTDYRSLADQIGEDCRIVELGGQAVAFNPLVRPAGVPATVFATRIAAAFDATYDLSTSYPAAATMLTRAVHRTLAERQPSMMRLYAAVRDLINESQYSERVKGDLEAALANRLELLTDGSLGNALMGGRDAAVDWGDVLARPTIVLAREFAGPRERALLMSLLLAGLVSYREYHPSADGLQHVTVIEEAHRILAAGGRAGFVNDGAQAFVDAMAELRGAGEGFLVVEQAPSRLVPEIRKLVGTVIAHRTVDAEERTVLSSSLTLPADEKALARLGPGQTVVLAADMLTPAVVAVERTPSEASATPAEVSRSLSPPSAPVRLWCQQCPVACRGSAGAVAVEDVHEAAPDLDWLAALKLVTSKGLGREQAYCAIAFAYAQEAADEQSWAARRRELLVTFNYRVKKGDPR